MITFTHTGNFNHTEGFFKRMINSDYKRILKRYGKIGVQALVSATPEDTGLTADSWDYNIDVTKNTLRLTWTNSHIVDNVPIAVIIQYGHGTRNGGYVKGRDYINPAIVPVFDEIMKEIWAEVTK